MLILASQSPRRRELLSLIAGEFEIVPSGADEESFCGGDVGNYVMRLAAAKAEWVAKRFPEDTVIGADTVVALSGRVLGKPRDEAVAKAMLASLSGREHSVFTGVCILRSGDEQVFFEETKVKFRSLTEAEIEDYVKTGEPLDKAGAYGIQGGARGFVEKITGDYFNVVGLPMKKTYEMLTSFTE